MATRIPFLFAMLPALFCAPASAGNFTAIVVNEDGKPVANAVVTLVHEGTASAPIASKQLEGEKSIDQREEKFLPLVTIVPKGGRIVFSNSDRTRHQVYSFSAAKQFEVTLSRGEKSPPIGFDKAGVVALGCNIHDNMIAYAFVADTPWAALTGEDGRAVIADAPPGRFQVRV
jgi:plastocyanin